MAYILWFFVLLGGCAAWSPHYDTVAPPTNYQRGEDAMRRGELDMAARLFEVYIRETADPIYRPRAYFQLARAYYGLGQYRKALGTLDDLDKEFPKEHWPQTAALRGDAEYALGNRTSGFLNWEMAWQRGTSVDQAALRERMGRAVGELSPDELSELQRIVTVPEVRDMLRTPLSATDMAGKSAREGASDSLAAGEAEPAPSGRSTRSKATAATEKTEEVDSEADEEVPSGGEKLPYEEASQPKGGPRLGALLPLTGNQRASGQQALRALRLAENRSLPIVLRDTGSDPALAARLFSSMAKDPSVLAVIAPLPSNEAAAVAPLADQLAIPVLLPPDYSGPSGRFTVKPGTPSNDQLQALVDYAFTTLKLKRFGVLYPNDEKGHGRMEAFQDAAVDHGATLVGIKGYAPDKTEFASEVAAVLRWQTEGGLEAVFIPDGAQTLTTLGAALHARSPKLLLLGLAASSDRPELTRAGAGIEGAVFASIDTGPPPATTSQNTSPVETQAFNATMLGKKALERGAKSRPEMLSQLRQLSGTGGTDQLLRIHQGRLESIAAGTTES